MFPIIVKNSIIPKLFNCIGCQTYSIIIYPFIFIINENDLPVLYNYDRVINHELIHYKQYNELLVIGFYFFYISNFFYNLIRYCDIYKAYQNILFEKEAYENDDNMEYLKNRKNFSWLKLRNH